MKKLKYLLISIFLLPMINVKAASGVVDIYTSNKTPAPGNSFTVTVYCKSSSTIGTCEYTLSYDSSKVKFISASDTTNCNGTYCNYYIGSTSSSKTFTFKALANGSTTISAKAIDIIGMDEASMASSVSPVSLTIKTPEVAKPITYSTNNNLSSLSVTGYEISPNFNKNTTSYTVKVPSNIEEITIEATKEDSRAKISGTGKLAVSEGENKFNVIVTSEKGTTKTYTINVNVIDENPITVTSDENTYTIVKRKSTLKAPENYIEKTITINDIEIPAFYNETTNYTLVGLKDKDGNSALYIYDSKNDTYELYKETTFNAIKLNFLTPDDIPKDFSKKTITINDNEVIAYESTNEKNYLFVYAKNIETGEESWYRYEKDENTVQKYQLNIDDKNESKISETDKLIYILIIIIIFLSFLLLVVADKNTKKYKKRRKEKQEKIYKNEILEKQITTEEKNIKDELIVELSKTNDSKELTNNENETSQDDIKTKKKRKKDLFDDM